MFENQNDINYIILTNALRILNLKFPVADISKKTGFGKGNVSNYIRGKVSVYDNFINTFLEAYNLDRVDLINNVNEPNAIYGELFLEKDGLGINVNMYAYKGKGGNDKLLSGIGLDAIQSQYGHQNKKMTEHYVTEIKGVYKQDIINNSPDF